MSDDNNNGETLERQPLADQVAVLKVQVDTLASQLVEATASTREATRLMAAITNRALGLAESAMTQQAVAHQISGLAPRGPVTACGDNDAKTPVKG
jgi:hypothetical protein